ncbi:response regulator transcription factor [Nonomuraea deserti]|uniref:Response regulator transcription factor n=2 Tax=Nonomuraea deserti TaxID=1848322 RepID=A0A4R4V6B6_9ACTN|nr:response regulator transcription factor [Nonomuraea deserti]
MKAHFGQYGEQRPGQRPGRPSATWPGALPFTADSQGVIIELSSTDAIVTSMHVQSEAVRRPALVVGDLTLDQRTREVRRAGVEIKLSPTEFELLRFLMHHPGRVLSKARILNRVWAYDFGGQGNVVELYISYLRRKVDARRQPMIHTVRGVGYTIKPAG